MLLLAILLAIVDTRRPGARKPTQKASANRVNKSRSREPSARDQRRRRSPSQIIPKTPPRAPTPKDVINVERVDLQRSINNLITQERRNTDLTRLRAELTRL